MNYLLDFIICSLVTLGELTGVIIITLLIQGIFYRIFKINLYKKLIKVLDR